MALQINATAEVRDGVFFLVDETGNYDAISNPGGYGPPNLLNNMLYPIVLNFTYPDGTIVSKNTDDDGFGLFWPDSSATLTEDYMGYTFTDGIYTINLIAYSPFGVGSAQTFRVLYLKEIMCSISSIALQYANNMAEFVKMGFKELYDGIEIAFACGNYTTAESMIATLQAKIEKFNVANPDCRC